MNNDQLLYEIVNLKARLQAFEGLYFGFLAADSDRKYVRDSKRMLKEFHKEKLYGLLGDMIEIPELRSVLNEAPYEIKKMLTPRLNYLKNREAGNYEI